MQPRRHPFQGIFVPGQRVAVHKSVEARILALDDYK